MHRVITRLACSQRSASDTPVPAEESAIVSLSDHKSELGLAPYQKHGGTGITWSLGGARQLLPHPQCGFLQQLQVLLGGSPTRNGTDVALLVWQR